MPYSEDELLPISAIQHFLFCNRRAALIHTESVWAENHFTVEGTQLHERVDNPHDRQNRRAVKIERAVGLCSYQYGLTGRSDVIEFHRTDSESPYDIHIIEYKRGMPKQRLDFPYFAQLCAQALCVEEMLGFRVVRASIYYCKNRRRHLVDLSQQLREKTRSSVEQLHALIQSGRTPLPEFKPRKCGRCSLIDLCLPTAPRPTATASRYLQSLISSDAIETT